MATTVLIGDCRERLAELEAGSVQTVVTSPPYFGLRDYGMENQIGLEATPYGFVQELVQVFRAIRRVLKDDGTVWLNLGDSYYNYRPGSFDDNRAHAFGGARTDDKKRGLPSDPSASKRGRRIDGLKEKDLIGIPWRVAFALQADGWYLRQDIIWHKPNPMPESVKDRCTKAHEYIFLLSKSERYYFDAGAIGEMAIDGTMKNKRSVWSVQTKPFSGAHFATFPPDLVEPCIKAGSRVGDTVLDPFGGAGTTALVANRFERHAILCELNPAYAQMAQDRLAADAGLFSEVVNV
jgi:DNA modification methylase